MTREEIKNNVGYWQEKANLEYIRKRQEHGINDPYMIIEIDEAFDAGFDKGYQYAVANAATRKGGKEMSKTLGQILDDLNIEYSTAMTVDWQQVRIQASIAAMQAFIGVPQIPFGHIAKESVKLADALIEELKGGQDETDKRTS